MSLVLFAAFADEVGCAKGGEYRDAAAEGCILVGVQSVGGQSRSEDIARLGRTVENGVTPLLHHF